jgi:hypothetical protein
MTIYSDISTIKVGNFNSTELVLNSLRTLCLPGHVYELRCLAYTLNGKWPQTVSGYYDDLGIMARDAAAYDGHCKGVYLTLNPAAADLKARSYNHVREGVKDDETTKDKHVVRRAWLPIDFDPERVSGVSSTDREHDAALARAQECRDWLRGQGFPESVLADSGNGGHLLYRIDLPNDDDATRLLADFLKAVDATFSDAHIKVDTTIFNASRIWKLYGTVARKGDDIPERPHRRSAILELPDTLACVSREVLERVVGPAPAPVASATVTAALLPARQGPAFSPSEGTAFDVTGWLDKHGLAVLKTEPYHGGGKWVLKCCPFNPAHTGGCAAVLQRPDGKLGFKCQHNSCKGKGWRAVREHFGEKPERRRTQSAAERLKDLALSNAELFTTPDGTAYARVTGGGRRDCFKVVSTPFRRWLAGLAEGSGVTANKTAVGDAVFAVEARAFGGGAKEEVHLRVARTGSHIYVDLADDLGRVVEVTAGGWRVVADCPVAFVRHENMAPLPVPERGGSLQDLRRFLNVTDDEFPLVRGFILDCFKAVGPYTVLLINGEQGSAKSTATKILRQVIDPVHKALARRLQRDEYELAIAAQRNAVLFFDNVSSLPQWLSDAIASLATGSGFAVRTLYSQDEETVYGNAVPVCFNGIPDFAESSDLLDRAIRVTLPRIPDDKRLSEDDFEADFQAARPRILAAVLDALSAGLRNYEGVKLASLPRMARSARWIAACEMGLPEDQGSFAEAYERNREELHSLAIDHSPVATALIAWMDRRVAVAGKKNPERKVEPDKPWEGRASDLHDELLGVVNGLVATSSGFPKAPNKLSGELRRLAPALLKAGVRVTLGRSKHGSKITVERVGGGDGGPRVRSIRFPVVPAGWPTGRSGVPGPGYDMDDAGEGLLPYFSADYGPFADLAPVAG